MFVVVSSSFDEYVFDFLIINILLWNNKLLKFLFFFVDCRYELFLIKNLLFMGDWYFLGNDIMYDDFNYILVGGVF